MCYFRRDNELRKNASQVGAMIKTISYLYETNESLENFIEKNSLYEYPNILIQVFSGIVNQGIIQSIQETIKAELPLSTVVGCTSSGEITEGIQTKQQITINFTVFEKTEIYSSLFRLQDYASEHELGRSIASNLCHFDTKAVIILSTNNRVEVQSVLDGLYEANSECVIVGGVASGNDIHQDGLVFHDGETTSEGIVAVALNSTHLHVQTYSNHGLQKVGKDFTITKVKGKCVYSIDRKKPTQILESYLGTDFIKRIGSLRKQFPFIIERGGYRASVWVTKFLDNGAVELSQEVSEGDKLTFAFADLRKIVDDSLRRMNRLAKLNIETTFTYHCLARQNLLSDFAAEEIRMLNEIAPSIGFIASGEIATELGEKPKIMGHSFVSLALSENKMTQSSRNLSFNYKADRDLQTMITLTHLMQASHEDIKVLIDSMHLSEQYYRSLFDNNTDIVFSTDLKGYFTSVNPAFEKVFGYTKEEVLGKSALKYLNDDDVPRVRMHFHKAIKGKEQFYTVKVLNKSGENNIFQMKNIPITVNGDSVGIYGIGRNITEQKKIEDRIIQLAYYDQDTGLPNRIMFSEKLGELLKRAKKKKRMLAVMSIDMDRFKLINDSLGHDAGDEILKEISERIMKTIPSGSNLGRFGGDKFNLVLSKNETVDEVIRIAKAILRQISAPLFHSNQELYVTASIGISFFPNDGLNEITLLKNADIAMNRSKSPGGNRITLYSNDMNEEVLRRLELESYLRKALQKEEFFLCYQPLIHLETGEVYGSEALIRWNHPILGLVSPGDFIPLAEETGLIEEIGSWVLKTACKQNRQWQRMGLAELSVSVNVSANQFQQVRFVNEVKRALEESGLAPEYLTLELTESTMLKNIEHSIEVMTALQELGVRVSIDDFGTGYSSLSYLKDLPINTLKIDRSFINNLRLDTSDIAIVKAIITMGHGLSVKVVAEGVETEEQIELLKELKCHYAQGFYLHRPLTVDAFEKALSLEKNA